MKRNLKIFILSLLIVFSVHVSARVKWEPLEVPGKAKRIIGGTSLKDYWLLDKENTILHFADGHWFTYPLPKLFSVKNIRNYRPILKYNGQLFVFLTDMDWKTHIAEINNGTIIRYPYVAESVLDHIVNIGNTYYAFGNFGIILRMFNNRWTKVDSPIHVHILSTAVDTKGTIWLGTNGEGVWSWNGNTFQQFRIPVKNEKEAVTEMKMVRDTLFVNTSKDVAYKLIGKTFLPVPAQQTPFTNNIKLLSNGYYKIVSNGKTRYIPYIYKIKSFKELDDHHALMLTQNGQLFYDQQVNTNFFLNFSSILGLEGPKYSYMPVYLAPDNNTNSLYQKLHPGIIFSDFNKDTYEDILFFNVSNKRNPFLYINNRNHYFNNFAGPLGLNNYSYNGYFSYAFDLNGDNIPEIISSDFRNRNYYLNILEKTAGRYQLNTSIRIQKKYASKPISNISFTDIDRDGDLDIALVFGYSNTGKGSITILKNNGFGEFSKPDTMLTSLCEGWNAQAIFADFNNDGYDDIFVLRNWGVDAVFFRNKDNGWTKHLLKIAEKGCSQQRKSDAVAFDFDNDGDLDIIRLAEKPFIRLLQNDGRGNFTDITAKSGLNILNSAPKSGHITTGDFDNNGFIDLFITTHTKTGWKNYIFLNDSAHRFTNRSKAMGISNGQLEFAATGDIDNDGDIDLYGFRQGSNILWLNNLDSNNFLQLHLVGIKSNSAAIGSKIWLYVSGHLNDSHYLCGYREIGSKLTGLYYQNENIVHFGVDSRKHYDAKIIFPAGETKILRNLLPGQAIRINEISAPISWLYLFDNKVHVLLGDEVFLSYLLVVVLGLFILMLSIYLGTKSFRWDVRLTTIIISINLIIFSILLITLYSEPSHLKYYLPLMVIILGSFGPVGFFHWIKKFANLKSKEENDYALFQALQNFSHGAWASSNLNSVQLFFENLSAADLQDADYLAPFDKRKDTFFNLTLPVIEEIILFTKNNETNKEIAMEIEIHKNRMTKFLSSDFSQINTSEKEKLSTAIQKLREALSRLKKTVFADHSCYPSQILNNLRETLETGTSSNGISLKIINFLSEEDAVLMDAVALADIIDNCVQNAIKAMAANTDKQLIIKLIKGDPRVFIEITDNGCGIPMEKQEQIFENGFSTTHSTGYGLFYAKETLSKYGGRIFIKDSIPNQRTTFVIELQKGSTK